MLRSRAGDGELQGGWGGLLMDVYGFECRRAGFESHSAGRPTPYQGDFAASCWLSSMHSRLLTWLSLIWDVSQWNKHLTLHDARVELLTNEHDELAMWWDDCGDRSLWKHHSNILWRSSGLWSFSKHDLYLWIYQTLEVLIKIHLFFSSIEETVLTFHRGAYIYNLRYNILWERWFIKSFSLFILPCVASVSEMWRHEASWIRYHYN